MRKPNPDTPDRIRNLSVRIRRPLPAKYRKPVDYSVHGEPFKAERPLSFGQDPLLERLNGGRR